MKTNETKWSIGLVLGLLAEMLVYLTLAFGAAFLAGGAVGAALHAGGMELQGAVAWAWLVVVVMFGIFAVIGRPMGLFVRDEE